MVSAEIKGEITQIMESKSGIMLQWKGIQKILLQNGLAYTQEISPDFFLVHPMNRGGTGINGYNMHSKGALICSTGADLSQLEGSVAFEMNPMKNKSQVAFTAALAKQAEGLIAYPTGQERFLTVSKSHTTQFCKAIKSNCKTHQPTLASGDGCLGSHLLTRDPSLKKMVETGWTWCIILSCVEEAVPMLPSLVEAALNASNVVYEPQNEVQLMSTLVALAASKRPAMIDYEKSADELCHGGPLKTYATAIGKYVQLYGGKGIHIYMLHIFMPKPMATCMFHFLSCHE